jgi:uncharacterized phage-associated protein
MKHFNFEPQKAIHSILYILSKIGEADYHKIFKILYFAEQKHLLLYGRPVTSDEYQAMKFGPVPSYIYDIFKTVERGRGPFIDAKKYQHFFTITRYGNAPYVTALMPPDLEELSESDIEALEASINENKNLTFSQLVEKSHDEAWEAASMLIDTEMAYIEIAKAAGADTEMLKYILMNSENENSDLH